MRITLAYNQRREETEEQAELLSEEDVERLHNGLKALGHEITPVEVSVPTDKVIDRLIDSRPDLVFNAAEGTSGAMREAIYPAIYSHLGLPFTGGGTSLLLIDLDKRLAEKVLAVRGIRVPGGAFITAERRKLPENLRFPLMIKPNYEGSGKGIHQDSIVREPEEARERIDDLLQEFPEGLDVEEFIAGRELTVPMLEDWPGGLLEIVEHAFKGGGSTISSTTNGSENPRGAARSRSPAPRSSPPVSARTSSPPPPGSSASCPAPTWPGSISACTRTALPTSSRSIPCRGSSPAAP